MMRRFTARLASREAGLLSMILAGALGVRLLGVGRGLPYLHEWDEPTVLTYVIGMLQRGDLYPNAFVYPSVYYYMLLPVMYLHYFYLHAQGVLSGPWEIKVFHPHGAAGAGAYWWYLSPASFYLWGRVLTALIGTATVYVVDRIGTTVYGTTAGLLAAAFLALAPGAVYYSDTVRVDIPMVFFLTLTILAGSGIIQRGRLQDYILAGLLAGLAISTKTNAVVAVLALLVAHVMSPHRAGLVDRRVVAMGLCVFAGFAIGTPYVIIRPDPVITQTRDQALAYGGLPSLHLMRRVLPGYLAYFVGPSQGAEWFVTPHTAMGLLPAIAAVVGAAAGFLWDRRLHLYLLSFALPYFFFMSGQKLITLRSMMPVVPFAALFAAAAFVWAWRWLAARWPAAQTVRARGLAVAAVIAVLAAPGRESAVMAWTMGRRPDTRARAVEWLRQHVAPESRVALEKDLRWYMPDLDRLPFSLRFAPKDAQLAWYLQQKIDFAVVGDRSPLRSFPAVAAFPRPAYLYKKGSELWPQDSYPVVDPALYIVKPRMPEINAVFPVEIDVGDMVLGPVVVRGGGVYSETVRLPDQWFSPGSYTLSVTGGRPRPGATSADRITAKAVVGGMTVGTVTVDGTHPAQFTTPRFRIAQAGTLPIQVELTFEIRQPQPEEVWALHPPTNGCAIAPDTPTLNLQRLTVEAWIYLEGMNDPPGGMRPGLESEGPILGKWKHLGYYLRLVGDAYGRIYADLSVAGKFSVGRAGSVPRRKWTHVAATYDGHEARIYLNGIPELPARDPHHEGPVHAEGAPLAIGCRDPGTPYQTVFKGLIAGARVWNRALPPDVIWDEARLRVLSDTGEGLVGSWSFQSLVHGAVSDLSGTGNNLAVNSLQRLPSGNRPAGRPEWTPVQLLRTVTVDRVTP